MHAAGSQYCAPPIDQSIPCLASMDCATTTTTSSSLPAAELVASSWSGMDSSLALPAHVSW